MSRLLYIESGSYNGSSLIPPPSPLQTPLPQCITVDAWIGADIVILQCIPITHCIDVIMGPMASQITSLTIVYSAVYSGEDQRKHQSSASLAFVRGIHRSPVNSLHKWAVTRKLFPFDDVIMSKDWTMYHNFTKYPRESNDWGSK